MKRLKGTIFVGLDVETTGTDQNVHSLIQIGVCSPDLRRGPSFVSDIGHRIGSYEYSKEAMEITKFSHGRINDGPPPYQVDDALSAFLVNEFQMEKNAAGNWKDRFVPVGWNVGSFDMPFVLKTLPKTADLFSYRALDLNSVVFDQAVAMNVNRTERIKDKAKKHASEYLASLGHPEQWHDALYDARASIAAWDFLNEATASVLRALDAMALHHDILYK